MRILIGAVAAAAVLAGCASVGDTRSTPPLLSLNSKNSPKQVAECIRDGWQNIDVWGAGIGAALQESSGRFTVFSPDSQTPWNLADIQPVSGGSAIRYHFYRTWQSPNASITDVVKSCSK